jgi:membrane associated rhomboid family serine protease
MEHENECTSCAAEWLVLPAEPGNRHAPFTLSEKRAKLCSLVLDARKVPWHIERSRNGWHLLVPAEWYTEAMQELSLFEAENRNWPPLPPSSPPLVDNTLATVSVLLLLATFYNITRLEMPIFGMYPDWLGLGSAHAENILHGQWWRLITALTLHGSWLHLFSNLTIGGVFIVFLGRELGSGFAWSLMLSSGILGNLANAMTQQSAHNSIGASTLVFGAVGILAAISSTRYRHHLQKRWPLPVASAIALLALLGTEGKNTDLGAHLFGFVFGIGLGALAEYLIEKYGLPGRSLNTLLAIVCLVVVGGAWWAALVAG